MFFLFYFACFIFIFARQYSQTAAHRRGFGFRAAAAVSLNALHLLAANRGQDGMVWDLSRWKGGVCRILIPAHSLSSPADHGGGGGSSSSVCPVCPRETSESAVRKAPFCPIHSVTVRTVGSVFRRLPASTVALLSAFPSQNAQCACVHVCVCVFLVEKRFMCVRIFPLLGKTQFSSACDRNQHNNKKTIPKTHSATLRIVSGELARAGE